MKFDNKGLYWILLAMLVGLPALAGVEYDDSWRYVSVHVQEPNGEEWGDFTSNGDLGAWEAALNLEEGLYMASATQNTIIQEEDGGLIVSGSMQSAIQFPGTPPLAIVYGSAHMTITFHADEPFVIVGEAAVEGTNDEGLQLFLFEGMPSLDPLMASHLISGEHSLDHGEFAAGGEFTLMVENENLDINLEDGNLSCVSDFELRILPASAVATENTTWDKLRTLYR